MPLKLLISSVLFVSFFTRSAEAEVKVPKAQEEQTLADLQRRHGPYESTAPTVKIISPEPNTIISRRGTLRVRVIAKDNRSVAIVRIQFDVNGDGILDDLGDTQQSICTQRKSCASDRNVEFEAGFYEVSGPEGTRKIHVTVYDAAGLGVEAQVAVRVEGSL